MVITVEWRVLLAAAQSGDERAADRIAHRLIDWAQRHLTGAASPDKDARCVDFAEYMTRDQFTHLAAVETRCLATYLATSLRNFCVDQERSARSRQSWEVLASDRRSLEDEEDEEAAIDDFADTALDPEATVLLRAEAAAVRSEVAQLTPLNQRIFTLYFEEELTAVEIARRIGRDASTVRSHIFTIRSHLREFLRSWEA